jgi:hypothetical protein
MEPELMASDPSRIAFRQMMGVFAQYDKSMVVLKLAGARARKRAREPLRGPQALRVLRGRTNGRGAHAGAQE